MVYRKYQTRVVVLFLLFIVDLLQFTLLTYRSFPFSTLITERIIDYSFSRAIQQKKGTVDFRE